MLKSLFGDLAPSAGMRDPGRNADDFADTAVMDGDDDEADTRPPAADAHRRDLYVTGDPAQAMRAHFAAMQDGGPSGQRTLTLHDPADMWASAVVKALSDAGGLPVERLQLRDQLTLEALAMIERATLARRLDDTLKVYHTQVQAHGNGVQAVPLALLERSDLGTIIVGPLAPAEVDELLTTLHAATLGPHWRCPQLLFMLPVGALWIAHKIDALSWPARVKVTSTAEPLTSASAVWNRLLAHWNRIKPQPAVPAGAFFSPTGTMPLIDATAAAPRPATATTLLVGAAAPAPGFAATRDAAPATAGESPGPDPQQALAVLRELMLLDGLVYACVVDGNTGQVLACDAPGADVDRAAAASAEILRAHRRTLRQLGHPRPQDPVDEVMVTAGGRYHLMRTLQAHPHCHILAVLDKLRSNLAMTRFRVMEAQQVLT